MLGLGKWQCTVDNMFFQGKIFITISEKNGEYDFDFAIEGGTLPQITINEVTAEGNTITGKGTTAAMPGKELTATMTFTDDEHFEGGLKIPFLGTLKVKNGHKIG